MHREIKPAETCVQAIPIKRAFHFPAVPMMASMVGWAPTGSTFRRDCLQIGFPFRARHCTPELLEHNFPLPLPFPSVGQQHFHIEHETACIRGTKCLAVAAPSVELPVHEDGLDGGV